MISDLHQATQPADLEALPPKVGQAPPLGPHGLLGSPRVAGSLWTTVIVWDSSSGPCHQHRAHDWARRRRSGSRAEWVGEEGGDSRPCLPITPFLIISAGCSLTPFQADTATGSHEGIWQLQMKPLSPVRRPCLHPSSATRSPARGRH